MCVLVILTLTIKVTRPPSYDFDTQRINLMSVRCGNEHQLQPQWEGKCPLLMTVSYSTVTWLTHCQKRVILILLHRGIKLDQLHRSLITGHHPVSEKVSKCSISSAETFKTCHKVCSMSRATRCTAVSIAGALAICNAIKNSIFKALCVGW